MKLVLTGSTGFVGSEVLEQCQQHPDIESLVVLTRRPLNQSHSNSKTRNLIVKDFKQYSDEASEAISDADACIWTLGGSGAHDVEVEFPLAYAAAMNKYRNASSKPFHFVHCSGVMAERDQSKTLWFLQDGRREKGQAELELLQLATKSNAQHAWQTYIMRPSMVAKKSPSIIQKSMGLLLGSIRVDELAGAAIQLATNGYKMITLENKDLVELYNNASR